MRAVLALVLLVCSLFPITARAGALHDAAKSGDTAAIAAALDAGEEIDAKVGGSTPLYFATRRGHLTAAELLLERGADVNAMSNSGSALLAAVTKSKIELINLLLARGANPNSAFDGDTVIHVAARLPCLECLKALVLAGADVNAVNRLRESPIHLALRQGNRELADFLMGHGVVIPKPEEISGKLGGAKVERGVVVFNRECAGCHAVVEGAGRKQGPSLWGIIGRDKASAEDMPYSEVLQAWDGVWTYEDLNVFLFGPMITTPGVAMDVAGIPDEADRADVIVYLRSLSDNPQPLP
jgi:cytochrome c